MDPGYPVFMHYMNGMPNHHHKEPSSMLFLCNCFNNPLVYQDLKHLLFKCNVMSVSVINISPT